MSEMIDRIAMVLQLSCPREGMHKEVAEHMARCTLLAMREPTPDVRDALEAAFNSWHGVGAWKVGIDAALDTSDKSA